MSTYGETFKLKNERVQVSYSNGRCESNNRWNIPKGTVISLAVYPENGRKLADLKMDLTGFDKNPDPEILRHVFYTNSWAGVSITVDETDGEVYSIRYIPRSIDDDRRCSN